MRNAQTLIVCAFFVLFKTLSAQTIRFNKTLEFQGNSEWGNTIFIDEVDSNYIVVGSFWDSINYIGTYWNKIDKNGNLLYRTGFNKSGLSDLYAGDIYSGKRLSSGSYVQVGLIEKYAPFDRDIALYKFNKVGDTLFLKTYDVQNMTLAMRAYVTKKDEIVVSGGTYDSIVQNNDAAVLKIDSSGNLIWAKKFGGGFYDLAYNAIEYNANNYFIFCWRGYANLYGAPWVLKLDSSGNLVQQKWFYNLPAEPKMGGGFVATEGINKSMVVQGYFDTTTRAIIPPLEEIFYPAFLATMDTNMNLSFIYTFNEPDPSIPYIVKQIKDSSYIAIGYKDFSGAGFISKISPNGQLLWEREYVYGNQYDFNYFADFVETPDNGFIITGSTIGDFSQDLWLVKLDSLGLLDSVPVNSSTVLVNSSDNILQLYPNPAQNQLHLKIFFTQKQYETALLIVYDMLGSQIITENISLQQGKANHVIEINTLQNGNYIIIIQADGEVLKQKFVKN